MIEMLIVMGIIAILIVVSSVAWRTNRNRILFDQAEKNIVLALEKARSMAATGVGSGDYGVHLETAPNSKLVVYEVGCSTCKEIEYPLMLSDVATVNFPVIFNRITADKSTAEDATITIKLGDISDDYQNSAVISVKKDGTIIGY